MTHTPLCPCGSSFNYEVCCGPYIAGQKTAPTAESLMRSRYTAYTKANLNYIQQTMKSPAADNFDVVEVTAWLGQISWIKLEILQETQNNDHATVEFCAYYVYKKKIMCLHETSDFILHNHAWYYVDGKTVVREQSKVSSPKIGRNDSCPCGSDKKYKKCCGNNS